MSLRKRFVASWACCVALLVAAPAIAAGKHSSADGAPLFSDLGDLNWPITTKVEKAQRYFDQGMTFSYGFNHEEAIRSFKAAAALDPDCAMAYWGVALCLGPNINMPMDPAVAPEAWAYLEKAIAAKGKVSAKEQALIDALAKRYAPTAPEDRAPLDKAYADAMREVHKAYPDDLHVAALYVEAMMDLRPWNYWTRDGQPHEGTEEIVKTLEAILQKDPRHAGACHFYIHAVEASKEPGRAEKAADTLLTLVPAAGHLVHMPAHTYMRVGRYHDASHANRLADDADDSYVAQCLAQGVYPLTYHPHNTHFLAASAAMEGRSRLAIRNAEKTANLVAEGPADHPGMEFLQHFLATPLYAYVRFGKWEDVLKAPSPPSDRPYMMGVWRYARAVAMARKGHADAAQTELGALSQILDEKDMTKLMASPLNSAEVILTIAREVAAAEVEAAKGNHDAAVERYRKAIEFEDNLAYVEPPDWYTPARHGLGGLLLELGRPAEAEAVYRADLEVYPKNGWAYFGLWKALEAQGKDAAKEKDFFEQAWKYADIKLKSTRM